MIKITKKQLEERYKTENVRNLAKEFGVSVVTLMKVLKKNGIALKAPKNKIEILK
jgi:DNA-binding transcriptional regulator YhcF (GntR family)